MSGEPGKKRVFSGIQPTGNLHIGNYLGAVKQWVSFQSGYENLFCIVDLHAITLPQNPAVLKSKIREVAGLLVAAGLDPAVSTLFVQSHVRAHAELAWILNCFIPMGWMLRMTQYKEKKRNAFASVGLFDYPALMAADILLYDTDLVPVGSDQKQHVELARDVAARFNALYGRTLKVPEPMIPKTGARIMGLDDPARKMSKSKARPGQAIYLLDSPDDIRRKIMRARTDSRRSIRFDEDRPALRNLLTIYRLFSGLDRTEIENRFEGKGYADLKKELADLIIESLRPLQARYRDVTADPLVVESLLARGASAARPMAEKKIEAVKRIVGLG